MSPSISTSHQNLTSFFSIPVGVAGLVTLTAPALVAPQMLLNRKLLASTLRHIRMTLYESFHTYLALKSYFCSLAFQRAWRRWQL